MVSQLQDGRPQRAARPAHRTRPLGLSTGHGRVAGLDGLRAIAIVGVLIFHLRATWLPGGFLGVDVFFVVSGFLITTLLLRELADHGRLDLKAFYVRRARRLLPALVATLIGSLVAALIVERDLLLHAGRQVLGSLFFALNWVEIAAGSNYFDNAQPLLFMNFWSLAVEEQFYLFWPVLLTVLVAVTARWQARLTAVLGLAALSALLMAVLFEPEVATRVYYGTDTHLFGLMLGAGLAFLWSAPGQPGLSSAVWQRSVIPALAGALAVLAGTMVWMSEGAAVTFRGGILLASLATTVLLAALLTGPSWWVRAMEWRPLTWVGERSYGIYLWHWPVVLIVDEVWRTAPGTSAFLANRALAVAVTLGVAAASYRWLEMPIRRHGFRETWASAKEAVVMPGRGVYAARAAAAMAGVMALTACVAVATAPSESATQRMADANEDLISRSQVDETPPVIPTNPANPTKPAKPSATKPAPTKPAASPTASPKPTAKPTPTEQPSGMFDGRKAEGRRYPPAVPYPAEVGHVGENPVFTMPKGSEITAYGDSLIVTTAHALDWYFPKIAMDAKSNRQWDDGEAVISQTADRARRAVIIDFGTNAGVREKALRRSLDALGPNRMVVLVALYGKGSFVPSSNETLRRVAQEYPNVVVAPWDVVARQHPDSLQSDATHPDQDGAHLFAKTIAGAFAALAEKATGQAVEWEERNIP